MIKIKISNPIKGKNKISFMGFLMLKNLLKDYSIDITESDDFDYLLSLSCNSICKEYIKKKMK